MKKVKKNGLTWKWLNIEHFRSAYKTKTGKNKVKEK